MYDWYDTHGMEHDMVWMALSWVSASCAYLSRTLALNSLFENASIAYSKACRHASGSLAQKNLTVDIRTVNGCCSAGARVSRRDVLTFTMMFLVP
jgi:hypothetical protein